MSGANWELSVFNLIFLREVPNCPTGNFSLVLDLIIPYEKTETYFRVVYYFRHGVEIRRHNYHAAVPNDFKLNKYKTIDSN